MQNEQRKHQIYALSAALVGLGLLTLYFQACDLTSSGGFSFRSGRRYFLSCHSEQIGFLRYALLGGIGALLVSLICLYEAMGHRVKADPNLRFGILSEVESELVANLWSQAKQDNWEDEMHEYKVIIYAEGMLGSIFLGASKVDPVRFTDFLNEHGRQGWEVVTMEKDLRRTLAFFTRESYLVILKRKKDAA